MITSRINHLLPNLYLYYSCFHEKLTKTNKKNAKSVLLLVYQHYSNLSNDETSKIKHITNVLGSKRCIFFPTFLPGLGNRNRFFWET